MNFSFKNKNIVFLLNSPELGGAERQALALAGYLQNNLGCNIHICICMNRTPSIQFYNFYKEQNLRSLVLIKNPLEASRCFRQFKIQVKLLLFALKLRKFGPDLLIPYLNKPSLIAALCLKIAGAKLALWNNRGLEYYRNDNLEKRAVKDTRFFLVNSFESIIEIENNFNVKKNQIHFLSNFLTITTKINDSPLIANKEEIVIGMLAHFREGKLHDLLLESFFELFLKYKFIKLYLVGSVSDENSMIQLKHFVKYNNFEDKVLFMHDESGEKVIPEFDIAVLVSDKEGMPNSIMEYMYFEKPIICSNHSGNRYLLGNENQFLINNNKEELIEKIELLIINRDLRLSEGVKNRKRIIENFSVEKYVRELESIISIYDL